MCLRGFSTSTLSWSVLSGPSQSLTDWHGSRVARDTLEDARSHDQLRVTTPFFLRSTSRSGQFLATITEDASALVLPHRTTPLARSSSPHPHRMTRASWGGCRTSPGCGRVHSQPCETTPSSRRSTSSSGPSRETTTAAWLAPDPFLEITRLDQSLSHRTIPASWGGWRTPHEASEPSLAHHSSISPSSQYSLRTTQVSWTGWRPRPEPGSVSELAPSSRSCSPRSQCWTGSRRCWGTREHDQPQGSRPWPGCPWAPQRMSMTPVTWCGSRRLLGMLGHDQHRESRTLRGCRWSPPRPPMIRAIWPGSRQEAGSGHEGCLGLSAPPSPTRRWGPMWPSPCRSWPCTSRRIDPDVGGNGV